MKLLLSSLLILSVLVVGVNYAEAYEGNLDVRIDDTDKFRGDDIIVQGMLVEIEPTLGTTVQIRILDPDGNVIRTGESPIDSEVFLFEGIEEVWKFEYVINTSSGLEGYVRYILEATYDDKTTNQSFTFYPPLEEQVLAASTIPEPETQSIEKTLPDWVKNIFLWYGQDKISEKELLGSIEYLIEIGMIQVSK